MSSNSDSSNERRHPLEGLPFTPPHVGNYGPEPGDAATCSVCEKVMPDPPPWDYPVPNTQFDVCSFRCALELIERWIYRAL